MSDDRNPLSDDVVALELARHAWGFISREPTVDGKIKVLAIALGIACDESKQAGAEEMRERATTALAPIADEDMPEPYWDNARAHRMNWACAVGRCLNRVRALPLTPEEPRQPKVLVSVALPADPELPETSEKGV